MSLSVQSRSGLATTLLTCRPKYSAAVASALSCLLLHYVQGAPCHMASSSSIHQQQQQQQEQQVKRFGASSWVLDIAGLLNLGSSSSSSTADPVEPFTLYGTTR